jgi:hypothetical protein
MEDAKGVTESYPEGSPQALIANALSGAAPLGGLQSVDVSYDDLINLGRVESLQLVLLTLYKIWVGHLGHRSDSVRIGSLDVRFTNDGNFELKFTSRFMVSKEIQDIFKEALQDQNAEARQEFVAKLKEQL